MIEPFSPQGFSQHHLNAISLLLNGVVQKNWQHIHASQLRPHAFLFFDKQGKVRV